LPALPDAVFRVLGVIVGVALGVMTSLWAAVLTPLYIGSVRSPLAVIVALVSNVAIVYFTYVVTRHRGLALLPGVAWVIVMFLALTKTSGGDLIVTGTWVGGLTFLCGCFGWAASGYYLIMRRGPIDRSKTDGPLIVDIRKDPAPGAAGRSKPGSRGKTPGQRPGAKAS
jgi:hypothetical protein